METIAIKRSPADIKKKIENMTFTLVKSKENIPALVRKIGYNPIDKTEKGELNCVRPLAGKNYPRFHCYLKNKGDLLIFNLHLDQKRPSYAGTRAHSGDYDSEIVREESERIKKLLKPYDPQETKIFR